ncbi:MAG: prohibitin family protein [Nanoarchaeota archaeon]|nr:prohibitin family protein [Nanoarchaeota archaeon]
MQKTRFSREINPGRKIPTWWIFIVVLVVILLAKSIVIIDQTEVGVVKVLGKVSQNELDAGLHIVAPFITDVVKMPVYEKSIEMAGPDSIKALTNEGLEVVFDLAVQYRIDPAKADNVYSKLKVWEIWMNNRIRSRVRDVIANYKAEDLYTGNREAIQLEIVKSLESGFSEYGIVITAFLIRNIDLPDTVVERIEAKIGAKQEAERMEFVIQKEELERQRKVIEAKGISDANEVIAASLSERYLYWYWIQNLQNHESVYYVPVGDNGLPLFRGLGD